jgi:hypothetical protein
MKEIIKETQLIEAERGKIFKYFVLSYFNFKTLNLAIVRETQAFAYNLNIGWGNQIYIDLEITSCSVEDTAVPSFLTATPTTQTK